MERGLYIAASGMLAELVRQDQIANDLANAVDARLQGRPHGPGAFGELLLANSATGAQVGPQGTAVQVDEIETDFSPQPARETGEPLDFAIVGEGFFAVQTDGGTRYTRNGQFTADAAGALVTAQGDPVLGRGGSPSASAPTARSTRAASASSRLRQPAQGRRLARRGHARRQAAAARCAPARSRPRAPTPPARWST